MAYQAVGNSRRASMAGNQRLPLMRQMMRLERRVNQAQPEIKYTDLNVGDANVSDTAGSTLPLTQIAQGVTVNTRIGNYVRVKSVELHAYVTGSVSASLSDTSAWRLYVVRDTTQIGDTLPVLGDLVDQPSLPITQLRNVQQLKRFQVLYDSGPLILYPGLRATGNPNTAALEMTKFQVHIKKTGLNVEVAYNGVNATDIQLNGIYVMYSTNIAGTAGADILGVVATSRVGYTDA